MATTANRRNVALKEAMTKTHFLNALPESTGLQRKDVAAVLDHLGVVIERHVKKRAVGTFTLPGLLKIKVVRKPATKARKMISPFTGQEIHVGRETRVAGAEGSAPERAQAHDGVGPVPDRERGACRSRAPSRREWLGTCGRRNPTRHGTSPPAARDRLWRRIDALAPPG